MKQKAETESPPFGRERRRFTRVALDAHVAVRVIDTNALFHSRLRDLSENGVFIVTESTRPIGTNILLTITVNEGELAINARGLIVHEVTPDDAADGKPAGIGVMFTDLPEPSRTLVRQLVATGRPIR